jgi:hypothetical protein
MEPIAVLTGDLISSTSARVEAVERAMLTLSQAARTLGEWAGHDTRFTRFRGDGWQVYLERPGLTLRAALFLTAFLRAADVGLATRMAIAIAPVYRLGEAGLSGASGLAFERSGHGLDLMKAQDLIAFDMPSPNVPASPGPWQGAVLNLALWQASRWTREQATAMALALHPQPPTQDRIAQSLGITRQAVQIRLKGAGLHALRPALAAFEMEPKP